MQFSDISHVFVNKSDKPRALQPAQPCIIHTDEVTQDEWHHAADKDSLSGSLSVQSMLFPDRIQPQDIFSDDLRCTIIGVMFDSSHLPRKLKKAHRRGLFYRRNTKWKRRLSCIALRQEVEFVGRMCSSERTPDGKAWNFTIKSEPQD